MVVIVVLVLLEAGAIWGLRCWQDAHSPRPPQHLVSSTADAWRSLGRPVLTEDDVIRFGLALEASDDVMSDVLADSR
jgi:hypothetical protein